MGLKNLMQAIGRGSSEERNLEGDQFGNLYVAQGLPAYASLNAEEQGVSVMSTVAVAALVVRPSTLAAVTLFNNEQGGGKSYIIDRALVHQLVSTAAQGRLGLWLCMHPQMTKPTADITAFKGNRGDPVNTRAILDVGATVIDDGWFPWGNSVDVEPSGVLPGAQLDVRIEGRLIVPPQHGISLAVVASLAGITFTSGFSWNEKVLNLR